MTSIRFYVLSVAIALILACVLVKVYHSKRLNLSLTEAAYRGDTAAVRDLLAKGADVKAKDSRGWTALMEVSVRHDNPAVVQALIAKGTDVNAKANNGWTPLMQAAWNGYTGNMKVLLAKGASVNAKDKKGRTALTAAMRGHNTAVELLKQAGAKE